ncbi:acyl-CoA dehydrogenase family protein [Azohydromonas caseinilytica]|uniref:Acyl-CoA dehydrogenase family protein n=1 Tax=Azohydromonas caseinilytica TaxID=2728836 RepID=A0A848FF06_9BURK|nr:acyl-CoA dehydrogenase family protein [Azohydromonas caseinilytica]NML17998.1 acyl-CoA dehydrogenase family protein [Azohydromonas caseinilytica]
MSQADRQDQAAAELPLQYGPALALERALGDPGHPDNTWSWRNTMALDEADAFPEEAVAFLLGLNVHAAYVPRALGGEGGSSEAFVAIGRALARRSMSASVSFSTMLWTVLAWIGAEPEQKEAIAGWVLNQGNFPCLAYSEEHHGADLVANELTARRLPDGRYVLNGEKWPINRATRGGSLVMLARTDDSPSLRNHSLFIINKADLPGQRYYNLPRVKMHGLRGCDISGIGFRDCPVPASARIGAEGHGLELALKGFQITRTFCTALSLGVGDSMLRLVTDFAAERKLYGGTVLQLPHTRDVLANSYLSLLLAECVSMVSARGLHLFPAQFSAWSSVAKVQATYLVDHAGKELAAVLGARYFMRERHAEGMFQKFLRDGAVVSVFDGSSTVCLDSLATLLPSLVKGRAAAEPEDTSALYDLSQPLPAMPYERLNLFGRGRDAVMESLPGLLRKLQELQPSPACGAAALEALRAAAAGLQARVGALDAAVLAEPARSGQRNSARQFALAQRYCELHAAVSALGVWLHNREALGDFFAAGQWLLAALRRGGATHFECGELDPQLTEALMAQLERQHREHHMFSLLSWPLAERGSSQSLQPLFEIRNHEHQFA